MLTDNKIWVGTGDEGPVYMLPAMANRHGMISGATGTGKTVTLQVLAEGFSQLGVPVFMADVKGDLAGLAKPGERTQRITDRLEKVGLTSGYTNRAFPVTFWDVFGQSGHPVRATVSEMGPLLLARMLQINETQTGVLHLVFRIADEEGLLLIDLKDLRSMLVYVGEKSQDYTLRYGNISKSSIGAIQRAIAVLEDQGGHEFFGEPALEIADWFVKDERGQGMINILTADKLFLRPALYSAFMLWMLGELYELLPERGDAELPQMVFFFDEAHLLFEDCPKELLDKIQLTIRLIRSKGVAVFFVTQNPADVPSTVLSQLSARVQHALRAFTPAEQRIIASVAQTFRPNPNFDTQTAITNLATGEALLSFLQDDGSPSVTQRATILPPSSSIGFISDSLRAQLIDASDLKGKYEDMFDRESAYEILSGRYAQAGVRMTNILQPVPAQKTEVEIAQPVQEVQAISFKVYDPATGNYIDRVVEKTIYAPPAAQPAYPQTQTQEPAQPQAMPQAQQPVMPQTQQTMPPILAYNPKTGQYEPQEEPRAKAVKQAKQQPTTAERMLQSFTRSTASGAGYTVGRSITRNILGVFGIK
ncbi:MAG: DUF853 family protein [Clostridiales bacterium]|nr:DUF853 family protein [Clostridiales bacterium]